MGAGRALAWSSAAVVVALVLFPLLTGRPLASYPVSRSMEPTIGPFDVFLVDPYPGHLRVGDIVVFRSVTMGGPAVHRVAEVTPQGLVTRGDANPDVDQAGGEPLVTPDRVLGRVIVDARGAPLLVPRLGLPLAQIRGETLALGQRVGGQERLASLVFLGLAVTLLAGALPAGSRARSPGLPWRAARRALRRLAPRGLLGRHVALGLLVLLLASVGVAAWRSESTVYTTLVVVQQPSAADGHAAVAPGQSAARLITVGSLGFLPTLVVVDAGTSGIAPTGEAHARAAAWGQAEVGVREVARAQPGLQQDAVRVTRYPAVMPDSWTLALHRVAPGAPYAAYAAALALAGWVWYRELDVAGRRVGRWLGLREGGP